MKYKSVISTVVHCLLAATLTAATVSAQSAGALNGEALENARAISAAFEQVAETITPSVVTVTATKHMKQPVLRREYRGQAPLPFHEFFGDEFFERFFGQQMPQPFQQGGGTGFIIDREGHILTNRHVVGGADEVKVKLSDQRTFDAKIVGTDTRTDVALLKIKADRLTPVRLGDSEKLRIGEWVVAAGNPFGLDNTITTGIVSAKGRALNGGGQLEDYIQTDAAINPGNSGGPLVNLSGEVIGINTAIFTKSGGYMGIGFAIPVNMAKRVVADLREHGKVMHGWLGVMIQDLNEDLAATFNFEGTKGVLVGDVNPGSPAEKAGLKQGDIIIEFNGKKVNNSREIQKIVSVTAPGLKVPVTIIRDGEHGQVEVEIGEYQSDDDEALPIQDTQEDKLGASFESLTQDLQRQLNSRTTKGVVITGVAPGGPAHQAGLRRGDIIVSIAGKKVETAKDVRKILENTDLTKGVRLLVENERTTRFVVVKAND